MTDMVASFGYLRPRTVPDGVCCVEDLHTAYWNEYGGGLSMHFYERVALFERGRHLSKGAPKFGTPV